MPPKAGKLGSVLSSTDGVIWLKDWLFTWIEIMREIINNLNII